MATTPWGSLSEATRVAVCVHGLSLIVTTRAEPNSEVEPTPVLATPADSLSNTVYSSGPICSGSCCQAKISPALLSNWPGAAASLKLEALPPSCQMICPVWPLTLYTVQVSRASTSRLPSGSGLTALM